MQGSSKTYEYSGETTEWEDILIKKGITSKEEVLISKGLCPYDVSLTVYNHIAYLLPLIL